MTLSAEYKVWRGMKTRCYNENEKAYPRYGGRGIKMSDSWRDSFESFFSDMGARPSDLHTIERVDNDRGYEKGNCVWATMLEQCRNRSSSLHISYEGETLTLSEWSRRTGVKESTIALRLKKGWDIGIALHAKPYPKKAHPLPL